MQDTIKARVILENLLEKLTSKDNTQTELPSTETYLEVPPITREEKEDDK